MVKTRETDQVRQFPLSELRPNPLNPRDLDREDPEKLSELAASIESVGLLQPILALPDGTIIAGHRRWLACEMAGVTTVPVLVRQLDERAQIEAMLVENLQRNGLNTMELARGIRQLIDRGLEISNVATRVGFSKATVKTYLKALDLCPETQVMLARGSLPVSAIRYLAMVKSTSAQASIASRAAEQGWMVSEIADAVDSICTIAGGDKGQVARSHSMPRRSTSSGQSEKSQIALAGEYIICLMRVIAAHPKIVHDSHFVGLCGDLTATIKRARGS